MLGTQELALIISLLALITTIVIFLFGFRSKNECNKLREECQETIENQRKCIWEKIDKMYEWMVTGVIQINRKNL